MRILISFSVEEILLLRYANRSTHFRCWPFNVEMAPSLKLKNSVLSESTYRSMSVTACSKRCNRDSAWVGVFPRSARLFVLFASKIVSLGYHLLLAFPFV